MDSAAYLQNLSQGCRNQYDQYPDGTLHFSSDSYLQRLILPRDKGRIIFSMDYTLRPDNVAWVYKTSRRIGFDTFAREWRLGICLAPFPQNAAQKNWA